MYQEARLSNTLEATYGCNNLVQYIMVLHDNRQQFDSVPRDVVYKCNAILQACFLISHMHLLSRLVGLPTEGLY